MRRRRILTLTTALLTSLVIIGSLAVQSAQASDNQYLKAARTGVAASLTVDWTGASSFVLRNARLRDNACDSQPVFFYVETSGFQFPKHFSHKGCQPQPDGSLLVFDPLPGSTSWEMQSLVLWACVDTLVARCSSSVVSTNPYF